MLAYSFPNSFSTETAVEGLSICLAKGRMLYPSVEFLRSKGVEIFFVDEDDRRLLFEVPFKQWRARVILAKPFDVPTYVKYGAADVGVVGKDVLMEEKSEFGGGLYELEDLGFGEGRLVLAAPEDMIGRGLTWRVPGVRVATKFPNIARAFFAEEGVAAEIIKVQGATELAPLVGLSDVILDIVSTGRTLKENNLVEMATLARISARLIANAPAMNLKGEIIRTLIDGLAHRCGES
ncbi:MAG TPA: ATP phosphoribosyltransferase [Clostridia bacterium]|nr:ATP phosphoribosyltransferase [Clostridia bacterium]